MFFTNGRKAWKADGTLITDALLGGNECGATEDRGSTVNGVMVVRHPLLSSRYYVINIDDIVNQTCTNNGVTVAIIDSSGNLVQGSQLIEQNISVGALGKIRTTESIAATLHGNGVDIWVTVQPLDANYFASYLLTADGFVSTPVISVGMIQPTAINQGNGDLAFSWDGSRFACGVDVNVGDASAGTEQGYGTVNLYDFDNYTGLISNRKAIYHSQWGTVTITNVVFSADGLELHYTGVTQSGKYTLGGSASQIRASYGASTLSSGFYAVSTNSQGNMVSRNDLNNQFTVVGGSSSNGMNRMYIPPTEEPTIGAVNVLCDTSSVVDLATTWNCSGVDAEDSLSTVSSQYIGTGIIYDGAGIFDPKVAGVGNHEIIFAKANVNDTIIIQVVACGPVGKDNVETMTVDLVPNPAYSLIKVIVQSNGPVLIELVSLTGTVLRSVKSSHRINRLDLSNLRSGMYVVKVTSDTEAVFTKRMIKL